SNASPSRDPPARRRRSPESWRPGNPTCRTVRGPPPGSRPWSLRTIFSLVVRGAVSTAWIRFPIPLSIRACGFPAHGLPMIFVTWLRSLRVADGAAESVQAVPVEPLFGPLTSLSGTQVAAPLHHHQAEQTPRDVAVDLKELDGGVASTKVSAPAA